MGPGFSLVSLMALMVVAGLAWTASARAAEPSGGKKSLGGRVVKQGKILIVRGMRGGEPQITDEQGKRFLLTGQWRAELLRVQGHTVRVWGQLGRKKMMMPTVEVERYRIIDAGGGKRPVVGLLRQATDKSLVLERHGELISVRARPALKRQLIQRLGCKVWIVGEMTSGVLNASRFGWLSCKKVRIKAKKETPR